MNKTFKVTIIVPGKFHAFNLAKGLQNKNVLKTLITSYPKYLVIRDDINKKIVKSIFIKEILERILLKLKLNILLSKSYYYINLLFEYISSKRIDYDSTDILVSWSGVAEKSFIKSKTKKIIKILERGSSHIVFQNKILIEEAKILGLKKKPIDERIIQKEIREYELADYISVPSNFAKQTFIDNGINCQKIITIPYGTNLKQFYKLDLKPNEFTIISTGQISIRKGSIYLLKAFEELDLKNCKLILVGNIESELNEILKPYFSNPNITFEKHVKQIRLIDYYNRSHIFVTSSLEEGLSMVQPQAMACGLPIICTTNSGGEELVDDGENGFIGPIRDIGFLKEKIKFFYDNKDELEKFSKKSNEKAIKYFSWENYSEKVYKQYNKLILEKRMN